MILWLMLVSWLCVLLIVILFGSLLHSKNLEADRRSRFFGSVWPGVILFSALTTAVTATYYWWGNL